MRAPRPTRILLVITAALLVAAVGVSGAEGRARSATAPSTAPLPLTPPRTQLTQFSCVHALDPVDRSVSVSAVMRPLPGTRRLSVRFDLLQQLPGAPAVALRGGDLGLFRSPPDPTLGRLPGDVWRKVKQVINLAAPAAYQFRVTFRWSGERGKVLGTATRYSRVCRQRELRPDLLVSGVGVTPIAGHPNHELYTATIVNQGATGAGPFEVLFTPGDGSAPMTQGIAWLGAHQTSQLTFTGPVCNPSSPSQVTADSAGQVDDFDRSNNALSVVCPAVGSGG